MEGNRYQIFQGLGAASGSAAVVYSVVDTWTWTDCSEGVFLTQEIADRKAASLNAQPGSAGN